MRWLAWLGFILFFGLLAVDAYLYLEHWRPLQHRYQELLEKHTHLLGLLPGDTTATPASQAPEPREPSLLEGLSASADTGHRISVSFKTLDLFAKWSDRLTSGGTKLLEQLLVGIQPSKVQRVTIRVYQGPYKTLTRKRLRTLRQWFVRRGIPASRIRTEATNRLRKWHTHIEIRLQG